MSGSSFTEMLALMARDATVPVEKMRVVIDAVNAERRQLAQSAFVAAFQALHDDLPEIDENGAMFRDGRQISKYSKWEDIQRTLKPLLKAHGFTLSFSNNFPSPREIEVVAVLTHRDGHHTENAFRLAADETGHKNDNQALGSSQTYGMRYATLGLLNIITRGADVDMGDAPRHAVSLPRPDGYEKAIKSLHRAANKGESALGRALKKLHMSVIEALVIGDVSTWHEIKRTALENTDVVL